MFCRHCGNRLPAYARFCNKCGEPQTLPPPGQEGAAPLVVRSSGPTNNPEIYPQGSIGPFSPPVQTPGIPSAPYPAPQLPNVSRRS